MKKFSLIFIYMLISIQAFAVAESRFNYTPVFIINEKGEEVEAPQEIIDNLKSAEERVAGPIIDACIEAGHTYYYNAENNTTINNGIVVLEPGQKYERKTVADNIGKGVGNVILFIPRIIGKIFVGIVSIADRQITGLHTLDNAPSKMLNPDKFSHAYDTANINDNNGWVNIHKVEDEYIDKAYVVNTPDAMDNFMRDFYKKGTGCGENNTL